MDFQFSKNSSKSICMNLHLSSKNGYANKLIVKNLKKYFHKREIVKDISLKINSGEIVGLFGPNGSGKTTCFYMIIGLIPVDYGAIKLDNIEITKIPLFKRARMGLSYLPQDISIFRRLTVRQNIQAILELRVDSQGGSLDSSMLNEQTDYLLNDLKIDHISQNLGSELSGGERRRVEIARTLATCPKFILLDEPFSGVDPISVIDIQNVILLLKNRGIGILITDHNVRETLSICDHAYIISNGNVLINGSPNELVENSLVRKVYLGNDFYMRKTFPK